MPLIPVMRLVASFTLTLLISPGVVAQTSAASETKGDQAVILSPFEVNTSRDVGFVAASSLAGGRLASDLKDTAVAYSLPQDIIRLPLLCR